MVFACTLGSISTSRLDGFAPASRGMQGAIWGTKFSTNLRVHLSGPLNLDAGAAVAELGRFFGNAPRSTYEVFSRLQLQY